MHLRVQSRTLNLMFSGACIFKFNLWLWTQVPSLTLNSSSTLIFELWYLSVTVYKSDCFHVHFMTKLSYTHTHEWRSIWNKKCGKKWIYKTNNWQSYVLSDDVCIKHTKYNKPYGENVTSSKHAESMQQACSKHATSKLQASSKQQFSPSHGLI